VEGIERVEQSGIAWLPCSRIQLRPEHSQIGTGVEPVDDRENFLRSVRDDQVDRSSLLSSGCLA